MFYNKDLFNANGVEVPKTWDAFVETCEVFRENGIDPILFGGKDQWGAMAGSTKG